MNLSIFHFLIKNLALTINRLTSFHFPKDFETGFIRSLLCASRPKGIQIQYRDR